MSRAAREILERLDDLMAEVAHGMRNPLNAIFASLELLRDGDGERSAEIVKRSAQRIERLLGSLEDVIAIERGVFEVQPKEQAFLPLVQQAITAVRPLAERRGVIVQTQGPENAMVTCDGERVAQLLESLVKNGVQHTQAEGSVSVRWQAVGLRWVVTVQDSGIGMTQEKLRVLLTTGVASERPRLNLFLGQAIARAHGGELTGESTEGLGSTFTFSVSNGAFDGISRPEPALTPDGLDH